MPGAPAWQRFIYLRLRRIWPAEEGSTWSKAKIIGSGREVEGRRKHWTFAADLAISVWQIEGKRLSTLCVTSPSVSGRSKELIDDRIKLAGPSFNLSAAGAQAIGMRFTNLQPVLASMERSAIQRAKLKSPDGSTGRREATNLLTWVEAGTTCGPARTVRVRNDRY